ncbi:hypothetical protein OOK31_05185 [Streptomyces sp. NBC_00249]|uniref:hypothetical protein n=1 Tax=Streptomyces sp. NBC_00249 TaxID=2975690 RepID=UPI002252DA6D|nr:hypothetical protein [Streptomyces sp. NBC_00249]MCX5193290.1 hypothetical protein [Streptomyces sp. NBC_00249]
MDPITAAALAALAGGLGGEAGRQAWQGLVTLVRRPFRRGGAEEAPDAAGPGELELVSLEGAPSDPARAQALATALGVRAALDGEFRGLLEDWWARARTVDASGDTHNQVSGQAGQVIQGRDFGSLTFNVHGSRPASD